MQLFGLIGNPLSHSFSKAYFTEKFATLGLPGHFYENFALDHISDFPKLLATHPDLTGLNVTIPYKESVIPYLESLSTHADRIGAVNTICFESSGLIGYNTDWIAFRDTLAPFLDRMPQRISALILGTGGASKAVGYALQQMQIPYELVSRKRLPSGLTYDELTPERLADTHLIINTTPLGMSPHVDAFPRIPYLTLGPQHLLYDLIYNPSETLFLQKGRDQGAMTVNGLAMLKGQAEESWRLWQEHTAGFVF